MRKRSVFWPTVAAILTACAPAAAETLVFKSGSCPPGDGSCVYSFGPSETMPLYIQNVVVKAPRSGVATVLLNGSMQCAYPSYTQGDVGVIDLTAVVSKGKSAPPVGGGGSVRLAMRVPPIVGTPGPALSYAVNLASTRVFEVEKGKTEFRYWFNKNRMDPDTTCSIFDITMTATFSD
ncbi:hypothetical protein [Chenggangzhangella methanolivorans]|uniref:Uncharacterized protein n=1 Tax=Chenggangzhangella methanolivorans TaxID=1437009 RepID=A0A9E6UN08_9HYPH|nr:hypothetical protein [Chenggangzhangella methanolivorans]QZN99703.1 hypothetical protein K6K41_24000 [Chenggangzhangella methanolivorans]